MGRTGVTRGFYRRGKEGSKAINVTDCLRRSEGQYDLSMKAGDTGKKATWNAMGGVVGC